jgi:hypothetical protein
MGDQRHVSAALFPVKIRYPLYRRLGGPQVRSGQVRKISPTPAFDPRTAQPRSESLYRLTYAGTLVKCNRGQWISVKCFSLGAVCAMWQSCGYQCNSFLRHEKLWFLKISNKTYIYSLHNFVLKSSCLQLVSIRYGSFSGRNHIKSVVDNARIKVLYKYANNVRVWCILIFWDP